MAIYQGHNEDSSGNILLSIGNGMTATVETGTKASQAYTKGAYLFFNNRLCKASSAISSGATLTIGGNLTQTSLGAEITSHLRSSDGKEFYFDVKNGQYGYYPSASKTASEFVPFGGTAQIVACTSNALGLNDVYTVLTNHVGKQCIALTYALASAAVTLTINGVSITPISQMLSTTHKEFAFLFTIPSSPSASNIVISNASGIAFNFAVLK